MKIKISFIHTFLITLIRSFLALGAAFRRNASAFCSRLGWPLRYTGPPPRGRAFAFFGDGSSSTLTKKRFLSDKKHKEGNKDNEYGMRQATAL